MVDQIEGSAGLWRNAVYGGGDLGFNLYWTTVSLYILYYYTDVLGIPASAAGLIFLVSMLWDAVTDPIMGVIAQKTQTRWGSYRPYIAAGAVPLCLSMMLLFYDPGLEGAALIAYALAVQVLFRTAYTVANIPYSALASSMTHSSRIRNVLSAWRISLATIGSAFVGYSTLKLVPVLGQGDVSRGFFLTATLYGILSLPFLLMVGCMLGKTREAPSANTSVSVREALDVLRKNRPFLIVLAATMCATLGGVISSKTLVYYFKYSLGNEAAVGMAFAANSLTILIATPLWALVTARTSKRFVWRAGASCSITGSVLLFLNPFETIWVVVALVTIVAVGASAGYLSFWSALPDTVEYGEVRSGKRVESPTFGVMSFAQKAAYGLAVALAGFLLDVIGYRPNEVQAQATIEGLRTIMTIVPAIFISAAFLIIGHYRLDAETHARLVAILRRRRCQEQLLSR
ncbi:MFS transporter [Erythrobacter sp. W302b]|uniref:MFS transporter n=1 Tax=Erythrobacter sp. W302b TaxID=3389874 RepID=UPI00396B2B90